MGPMTPLPSSPLASAGMEQAGSADGFVREYLALIKEGWNPDLQEYLSRVPETMRESVYREIDVALANTPVEKDPERVPPHVEVVVAPTALRLQAAGDAPDALILTPQGAEWIWRAASLAVPHSIRDLWLGELLANRRELSSAGASRFRVLCASLRDLATGLAQRAPLVMPPEGDAPEGRRAGRVTFWTTVAWRAVGPTLLAAAVLTSLYPLLFAAGLLGASLYGLLPVVAEDGALADAHEVRLANSVLGGLLVALGATAVLAVLGLGAIALQSAVPIPGLQAMGVRLLVLFDAGLAAFLTASNWSPEPWYPRRLVRTLPKAVRFRG